jgi:hypothetical protein
MLWEYIHWSDPTSLESLDLLIDRAALLRVLIILTLIGRMACRYSY